MPMHIGNLKSLCMLTKFIVGEGNDGLKISDLKELSQLTGKLEIQGLHHVGEMNSGNLIKEKPGLLELDLKWATGDIFYPPTSQNPDIHTGENSYIHDEEILKSLQQHQKICTVSIAKFGGRQFPSWIGDPTFAEMVKLVLTGCMNVKWLPPLGRLPFLKELIIERFRTVEEVGSEFYEDCSSFPCLEFLRISCMQEWKNWSWIGTLNEDSVQKFHKLCKLQIIGCPKLVGKLPSFLPSLEELEVSDCTRLIDLPGDLPSLKRLYIHECESVVLRNLNNVPSLTVVKIECRNGVLGLRESYTYSPRVLPSLRKLSVCGCQEAFFRNLCQVPCLTELKIENIRGLLQLDESYLQSMTALQKLEIHRCAELEYLCADGTSLDRLKDLMIWDCQNLVSLVNGTEGNLPINLEALLLVSCARLKELPNSLNSLKSLATFSVIGCSELASLPARGFPCSLKNLQISCCPSLEVMFSSEMPNLEKLEVSHHISVSFASNGRFADCLVSLGVEKGSKQLLDALHYGFSNLKELKINKCDELAYFPEREFPNVSSLVSLNISNCKRLKSLSNHMQSFNRLQVLEVSFCEDFESFPDMGLCNPSLVSFSIGYCCKLGSLPNGMQSLTSIQHLSISGLEISCLQGCLPSKLTELNITCCKNLSDGLAEWGLRTLTSLTRLSIELNSDMVSFPDSDGLLLPSSLTRLSISASENLESINKGIQNLISLDYLFIADCPKLETFLVAELPPALECVYICNCPLLKDWCSKDRGQYGPIILYTPYWE